MRTAEPTMDLDRRFEVLTKAAFVLLVRHVFKLDILLEGFFCLFVMPGTLQSLPEVPGRSHGYCEAMAHARTAGIWASGVTSVFLLTPWARPQAEEPYCYLTGMFQNIFVYL